MLQKRINIIVYAKEGTSWKYVAKAKCNKGLPGPLTGMHLRDRDWIVTDSLPLGSFAEDKDAIRVIVIPK